MIVTVRLQTYLAQLDIERCIIFELFKTLQLWITGKFREKLRIVEMLMLECLEKQEQHGQRKHLNRIQQNLKLLAKLASYMINDMKIAEYSH